MSQQISGQCGHLDFYHQPEKNTNLVEDVVILLPVKFRWILFRVDPFNSLREEVKCLSLSEAKADIWLFQLALTTNFVEDIDLASCQFWLNSVQLFQKKSRKCLSRSEARAVILFFQSALKHKLGRGRWDLASCQCLLNSLVQFRRRSQKHPSQSVTSVAILIFPSAGKHKIGRGRCDLASCQISLNFVRCGSVQQFQRSQMSQAIRGQGGHLAFPIGPNNKLCWGHWSCFLSILVEFRLAVSEEKSKNLSANQGQVRPSCFSNRP